MPPSERLSPLTRTRYRVVAFAVGLAAVIYLDRVCISTLAPQIMRDLSLSRIQMSFVFSAFTLAYAAFEIPTAWWADRIGTRKVLTRIVVWWSAFTMLTALAWNYLSLVVVRFLFGTGEAGAWPSAARTFSRWIPAVERGTVQGVFFMGAHLAGGLTPLVVTNLLLLFHWRAIFVLFGTLGLVWTFFWYRWFRDDPAQHPAVSPRELEHIHAGRKLDAPHHFGAREFLRLFRNRNLLPLCLMYFANGYGFYFYITWLPAYLEKERGFSAMALGLFSGLPLTLSVLGDLLGGVVTDRVTARLGLRAGRAGVGGCAYLVAGTAMILGTASGVPALSATLIALSAAACMFTLGAAWGTCIDIGGDHAGVVSAAMNTAGQIGGVLSPIILGFIVDRFAVWTAPLYLMGALYLLGAICWAFIDPRVRIE